MSGRARNPIEEIRCVGCGCTDSRPCITETGPCTWIVIVEESRSGLCSACAALPLETLIVRALAANLVAA